MKIQIVYLLVVGCLLSSSLPAQSEGFSPFTWRPFEPENEGFSIQTPISLKSDVPNDAQAPRKYYGNLLNVYLYVFSDTPKSSTYLPVVARFARSAGSTIPTEKIDNLEPVRLSFTDQFGFWNQIVILRTVTRIYIAQTVSKNVDDSIAKRFISTFVLGKNPPTGSEQVKVTPNETAIDSVSKQSSDSARARNSASETAGTGSGQGSGSGSNSGGIGIGTPTANPTQGQTVGLRLLTKPRPAYTDFARFYEISGIIKTRVTFLASGEIGSVTPVTFLPFGLTENAIAAAKSMRFEPAYRDGKPVSVTRPVEYSFLIY